MAAGLGFKTFTTGEVLTAADTNGYLMQGVLVFASSAARAAAITSPQEGQYSYLKDTNSTEYYDGAAWIAAPIGDITGVTAGTGISGGGTSGTVTITNSMATEIAAKGDLIVGTGAATFDNLAVGTNGMTIVADSSTATGLKWAAASSGALTLIKRATTSGAVNTGTTFDSVFTSTYKTYVIYISEFSAATGTDEPKWQFRFGGTTRATDYYGVTQSIERSGTVNTNSNVNAVASIIGNAGALNASATASYVMTVNRVGNSSQKPNAFFQGIGASNQIYIQGAIFNDAAATYDGFILSAASNITITVAVYGLATA